MFYSLEIVINDENTELMGDIETNGKSPIPFRTYVNMFVMVFQHPMNSCLVDVCVWCVG